MTDPIYAPPQARIADRAPVRVPSEITSRIRSAVIAGVIVAGLQAALIVAALFGKQQFGVDAWATVDVVLVLALAFGTHRRSRACAVLQLLLFIVGRVMYMAEAGRPSGLFISALVAYYYARGVLGTFRYHAFMRDPAASAAYGKALDEATSERIAAIEALREPETGRGESAPK